MEDILDDSMDKEPILKQRHGCVTAYLGFMIVTNSLMTLVYFFANSMFTELMPGSSPGMIYALGVLGIGNVIFGIMLWKWKKLGFYGFIGTSIVAAVLNTMMGIDIGSTILGLVGIGILYAILQIKEKERSAWENMED